MAVITGFTADRMKQIEDTTVVGGLVDVNGHLLLTTREGTEIDAGLVKGASGEDGEDGADGIGIKGDPGDPAIPAGTISLWPHENPPANWLICDGAAVSRTTYASLFNIIGTKYGAGDGSTTFNLPNLKGRTPVGRDAAQTEFDILGETGGAKTHTLTTAEMPSHRHRINQDNTPGYALTSPQSATKGASAWQGGTFSDRNGAAFTTYVDSAFNELTGGGGAHNNLQPYQVVNFIIKFSAGQTPGDSELTQRITVLETNATSKWKMKGVISPLWTTGNPKVTLTDGVVVTAVFGNRTFRARPGDEVLCENISGTWHILEITKANGPEWTNFLPLPIVNNYFRPWAQESNWVPRGDDAFYRDLDPAASFYLTKNSSGVVTIQGLCGSTGVPATTVFAILPEGFRPSTIRLFPCTYNETRIYVEIHPDGRMMFPGVAIPANAWVALSNVIFHDAAQDLNWITPTTFLNGFAKHPDVKYPIGYAVDSFGWVWFRGIVVPGTQGDNNPMFEVPKAYMPDRTYHLPAASNTNTGYLTVQHNQATGYLHFRVGGAAVTAWISADGIVYPPAPVPKALYGPGNTASDPLGAMNWFNSWAHYDPSYYPPLGFTKRSDGLVWWQGLIKSGTLAAQAAYVPRGYRPLMRIAFEKIANIAHARLAIDPTDKQLVPEVGTNLWFSVDGTAYQAAR